MGHAVEGHGHCVADQGLAVGDHHDDRHRQGRPDKWYLDFRKLQPNKGIERYQDPGSEGGGRCTPPPTRSQSEARPFARTSSPAGRHPSAGVPPGGHAPLRRDPLVGVPRRGNSRHQGGLERPDLHPADALWVFLGQVLNADQSCRAAVARLIAQRIAEGLPPCSSETGVYCQARMRLPERFFAAVARLVGQNLDARVDRRWLWKGRRFCLFDGSTVSMPDTPENRREYPLAYNQVPGTSIAPARIGAIISLSCGDPRPGHLPLRRQGPGGGQPPAPAVGRAPPRRRAAGRPPEVGLGRHVPAQAEGRRHGQPPVGAPQGRLPQGEAPGQRR
jgi:hypothetical protein